jgi:uncharacterized protein
MWLSLLLKGEPEMNNVAQGGLKQELDRMGNDRLDEFPDALGHTLFDLPASQDHTVTVVVPPEHLGKIASRALVRIRSRSVEQGGDGRSYLGIVVEGPFAEPDGLRGDAPVMVTTTVRGAMFIPRFHGRLQVRILGEELVDGAVVPPRFRPLPNSPVYSLTADETAQKLQVMGDVPLGFAIGYQDLEVCLSTQRKDVFPRHTAILGTTGTGKSTTVSNLVGGLNEAEVAVVVFDTEGEYTYLMEPTEDEAMKTLLEHASKSPKGLENVDIYHLVGRESSHPDYAYRYEFGLDFSQLSPYAIIEILGLNEAQQERFLRAYDIAKHLLNTLGIYPANSQEAREWLEMDELEVGYPCLTLQMTYDVVRACAELIADEEIHTFIAPEFEDQRQQVIDLLQARAHNLPGNPWSWRKVQGALGRLLRLRIFDTEDALLPDYETMTQPGRVTIVDLSGTDSRQVNNWVISQMLLGLRKQQEDNYRLTPEGQSPRKVVIIIEEAHEFLSSARIRQTEVLFDQLTRIARRGRKRWLGLVFVSQSPEDLPDQVLGLVNNFILHKLTNVNVINRLKRSVGGIDSGLWEQLSDLEPGVAIVKTGNLAQPLLVAMHPTSSKLLMID